MHTRCAAKDCNIAKVPSQGNCEPYFRCTPVWYGHGFSGFSVYLWMLTRCLSSFPFPHGILSIGGVSETCTIEILEPEDLNDHHPLILHSSGKSFDLLKDVSSPLILLQQIFSCTFGGTFIKACRVYSYCEMWHFSSCLWHNCVCPFVLTEHLVSCCAWSW